MLLGSLALCGIPPFAGFFSKDAIIEAVHFSNVPGHTYAYFAVVAGVFVTAFYTFRLMFLAFHGEERFRTAAHAHDEAKASHDDAQEAASGAGHEPAPHGHEAAPPHESPWVVTVPLVLLAIPSIYSGWAYIEPMLFDEFWRNSIVIAPAHAGLATMKEEWHGVGAFIRHGVLSLPFWLAIAGLAVAWLLYLGKPMLAAQAKRIAGPIYTLLDNKYYFDRFNDWFFAGGARKLGSVLSNVGDRTIIDGFFVNGTARVVGWASALLRHMQTGYIYHYAFTMIIGLFALLTWWVGR